MIEAALAVNEYMIEALDTADLTVGQVYPGVYAPASENSNKYMVYMVAPNDTFDLFGLKDDTITYVMYNDNFLALHAAWKCIRDTFNVDNGPADLEEDGVRFMDTEAKFNGEGSASFVDGTEYFTISFQINIKYTSAPIPDVGP